jgi:hypothetical protein
MTFLLPGARIAYARTVVTGRAFAQPEIVVSD